MDRQEEAVVSSVVVVDASELQLHPMEVDPTPVMPVLCYSREDLLLNALVMATIKALDIPVDEEVMFRIITITPVEVTILTDTPTEVVDVLVATRSTLVVVDDSLHEEAEDAVLDALVEDAVADADVVVKIITRKLEKLPLQQLLLP